MRRFCRTQKTAGTLDGLGLPGPGKRPVKLIALLGDPENIRHRSRLSEQALGWPTYGTVQAGN